MNFIDIVLKTCHVHNFFAVEDEKRVENIMKRIL